ncbi:MAG: hypothetical protein RLN89_02525 [Parvibaculum sp.]
MIPRAPLSILCLLATLFLVSACASPQERAARAAAQINADDQECTRLGFTPGTEKFADCLLRLKEIRAQEAKTRALNNVQRDPFWPWYSIHNRYRPYPYGRRYPYW